MILCCFLKQFVVKKQEDVEKKCRCASTRKNVESLEQIQWSLEDDQTTGAPPLQRKNYRAGLVQPGKGRTAGKPHYSLPVFKRRLKTGGKSTFYTGRL